jgi:hypothetical protein
MNDNNNESVSSVQSYDSLLKVRAIKADEVIAKV